MRIIENNKELQEVIYQIKSEGKTLGFCPTMGFLHKGHLSLIESSNEKCDFTLVSIYVNPSQFNDPKDFNAYPRDLDRDLALLSASKTDFLWLPKKEEIENIDLNFSMDFKGLDDIMEGKYRPGHFKGVTEVVYRLFKSVQPDYAFFGTKDYQQLKIIEQLVSQNNLPIKIIPCETFRENSGLAMSSRNTILSEADFKKSATINQTLQEIVSNNNLKQFNELKKEVIKKLENNGIDVEYLELHNLDNQSESERLFIAAKVGNVRLIDNIKIN